MNIYTKFRTLIEMSASRTSRRNAKVTIVFWSASVGNQYLAEKLQSARPSLNQHRAAIHFCNRQIGALSTVELTYSVDSLPPGFVLGFHPEPPMGNFLHQSPSLD